MVISETRSCKKCLIEQSIKNFRSQTVNGKVYIKYTCVACLNKYSQRYSDKRRRMAGIPRKKFNVEIYGKKLTHAEMKKIYYQKNKDKFIAKARKWINDNADVYKKRSLDYQNHLCESMSPYYVRKLLKSNGIKNPTPETIEKKTEILKTKRLIKKIKSKLNEGIKTNES